MELTMRIRGNRPMMQHNGRLANPLDPYARQMAAIAGKRKKTDEDRMELARIEARGACWETEDGKIGVPNAAVWRCMYTAATAYKRGEDIKRALGFADITEPLVIMGKQYMCDDFLKMEGSIDYRPVVVNRARSMRARPIIHEWETTHHFTLLDDVIDFDQLRPIVERAGRLVGLGEWRPTYGTFTATLEAE